MKNKILLSSVPLVCLTSIIPLAPKDKKVEFKQQDMILFNESYQVNVSMDHYVRDELDNIRIFGNYNKVEEDLTKNIRLDKETIYVLYDLNLEDNIEDKYEYYDNNVIVSYYVEDVLYNDFYNTNSIELDEIKEDINSFINEKIALVLKKKEEAKILELESISLVSDSSVKMKTIYENSFRVEKKPYGFVDINYTANKARVSDVSSLWLIETKSAFTPGVTAAQIGKNGYGEYYNARQYLKIVAYQPMNEVGYNQIRYGGEPIFKEAYPKNVPGKITITSTYSNNAHIGFSTQNGLEIGTGAAWTYNQTYETTEPALSAQRDPDDFTKYTWLYNYHSPRNETNNITNGYIFEQNNGGHDLLEDDIAFNVEFKFWVTPYENKNLEESRIESFSKTNDCMYV